MRDYYITKDIKWLECKDDWKGLKTIGKVVYTKIEFCDKFVEKILKFI